MIMKLFERWLDKNIDLFKYKPIKIGFGRYKFDGIVSNITLVIDNSSCEIDIFFDNDDGVNYDHYEIGYIEKARNVKNKGYTDTGWIGKYKNRFYPTYKDMIIENLFLPLISYCDNHFMDGNHLYLVNKSFLTFAMIGDENDAKKIKKLDTMTEVIDSKITQDTDTYATVTKIDIFKKNDTTLQ